jgi:hypothetical protein
MLALIIVMRITAITTLGRNANNTFGSVGIQIAGSRAAVSRNKSGFSRGPPGSFRRAFPCHSTAHTQLNLRTGAKGILPAVQSSPRFSASPFDLDELLLSGLVDQL